MSQLSQLQAAPPALSSPIHPRMFSVQTRTHQLLPSSTSLASDFSAVAGFAMDSPGIKEGLRESAWLLLACSLCISAHALQLGGRVRWAGGEQRCPRRSSKGEPASRGCSAEGSVTGQRLCIQTGDPRSCTQCASGLWCRAADNCLSAWERGRLLFGRANLACSSALLTVHNLPCITVQ